MGRALLSHSWSLESMASPGLHLQISLFQKDTNTDTCQEAKQANFIKQNKMKIKVYSTYNYEIILVPITPPLKFQLKFVTVLIQGLEE